MGELGKVRGNKLGTVCKDCEDEIIVGFAWTNDLCYACGHARFLVLNNMR